MRVRCLLFVAFAALAVPAVAQAKGASEATVTGPGLSKPLYFGGGEASGTPVMNLVENAGFFPAAFCCQTPNPIRSSAPNGVLGPKYTIHYVVPGDRTYRIDQDVYPYAKPSPVTYMAPGQAIFDRTTEGGWYVSSAALKRLLVGNGLPRRAPRLTTNNHRRTTGWIVGGAVAAAAAAAGGVGLFRRK